MSEFVYVCMYVCLCDSSSAGQITPTHLINDWLSNHQPNSVEFSENLKIIH